MPGLVGFVGNVDRIKSEELLDNMIRAMKGEDGYQVDSYLDKNIGLGCASLGFSNPESQPIWSEDKTLCIVLEGEIYDYQDLKQKLISRGHHFQINNDAEFILHLYMEYRDGFASYLNGAFVAAIWDAQSQTLMLVNDRLGLRPIYYASYKECFTFASGIRALLADPALSRSVDRVAIAQMLSFEYVLGNRTLLTEVELLPPASLLTLHKGHFTVRSYWSYKFPEVYQVRNREEYLEGLVYYMRQAVNRQMPGDLPAGLNLSGGLDSRMLLGLLCENQSKIPIRAYTFGVPGCDDVRIAQELAKVAGIQHHYFELTPDYLLELAEEGMRLTDGMYSIVHMHALANVKAQAGDVRILYTGFLIDYLISSTTDREWLANYDHDAIRKLFFDYIHVLFRGTSRKNLYTESFLHQIDGAFEEDFLGGVIDSKSTLLSDWRDRFDIHQRQRRFTKQGDELLRSQVICRTPFSDNDLIDFTLSIPPGLRLDRQLFKDALAKRFFSLAKVPLDKTGLPMVPCARELYLRIDQQARWQFRKYGFKWIPDRQHRGYADYDSWMRTVLHDWVEKTLLSEQALERGYFNPQLIRELVSSHMVDQDHSRELGVLISLELWHRQFID